MITEEHAEPPFGLFESVAAALIDGGGDKLEVHALDRNKLVLSMPVGLAHCDILVMHAGADHEGLVARVKKILEAPKSRPLDLVIVGGDAALSPALKKAKPMLKGGRVGLFHVRADGSAWTSSLSAVQKLLPTKDDALRERLAEFELDAAGWAALEEEVSDAIAASGDKSTELRAFAEVIKKRRPIATPAIAVLIGLVFLLQLYVGFDSPPQLMRLGALSTDRVLDGELWRLLSCTLLHGGWMHVAFNTYVLVALGIFLERIVGPARLVLLYVASALVGSLGSAALLGDGFSVGASGAVWGLLGAHAYLAFRPSGLLPQAMVAGARKAAAINLGINVMNSFQPHVDMWAHFAGGLAGAVLFAGVLSRGLARLPEPGSDAALPAQVKTPMPLWIGAGLAGATLPIAMAVAVVMGQPFALSEPPVFETQDIAALGVRAELPASLERSEVAEGELTLGDVRNDAALISLYTMELPPLAPPELEAEMQALIQNIGELPEATRDGPPQRFDDAGDAGIRVAYTYASGVVLERWFLFRPQLLVRVETLRWPDMPAAPANLAERITRSAQPLH